MSTLSNIIEESAVLVSIITTSIQDIELDNLGNIEGLCKDIKSGKYIVFLNYDIMQKIQDFKRNICYFSKP